jgi:NTE family protein
MPYEAPPHDDKCRALIMRGGGGKGAFEVGALQAMTDMMHPIDYAYDVVAGVSIGGLNAGMFASFPHGAERAAVNYMTEFWLLNPVIELWESFFLGFIQGLWRDTIYDTSIFVNVYHFVFDDFEEFFRELTVMSVDLNTGTIMSYDQNTPNDVLRQALLSTATVPAFLPPVKIDGMTLVDG